MAFSTLGHMEERTYLAVTSKPETSLLQSVLSLHLGDGSLANLAEAHMAVRVVKTTWVSAHPHPYGSFFRTTIPSPPPVTFSWAVITIASCAT